MLREFGKRKSIFFSVYGTDLQVRDEKEGEKIAAVAAEPASVQPQKTVRKRISPPLDVPPREEFRRDHAANR